MAKQLRYQGGSFQRFQCAGQLQEEADSLVGESSIYPHLHSQRRQRREMHQLQLATTSEEA